MTTNAKGMKPSEIINSRAIEIDRDTMFKGNNAVIKAILEYLDSQHEAKGEV